MSSFKSCLFLIIFNISTVTLTVRKREVVKRKNKMKRKVMRKVLQWKKIWPVQGGALASPFQINDIQLAHLKTSLH